MSENLCPCCHRPLPSVYEEAITEAGLSAQERRLFLSVASGAGDVVPHRKIIDDLWGDAAWGGPVDTGLHISVVVGRVNRKVGEVGYRITNVFGVGYRLAAVSVEAA